MAVKGPYTVAHNSDMNNWLEFLAKFILEDVDGASVGVLRKHESPDWLSDSLGVEVTTAFGPVYNEMNGKFEKECIDLLNGAYHAGREDIVPKRDAGKRRNVEKAERLSSIITVSGNYPIKTDVASGDL